MTTLGIADERQHRLEFWLLCLATFLCFATLSQTALLSVILVKQGIALPTTGVILSSYGITVILLSLFSGKVVNRIGALSTLRLGMILLLAAHLSYHFTIHSIPAAIASRLVQGAGFGLFMAPAMVYANTRLPKNRLVHLIGILASMIQLPQAVGPPLGKVWLDHFGSDHFFLVGATPALLAILLTWRMGKDQQNSRVGEKLSLLDTALQPGLRLPFAAILVSGTMLGLISSYMAPLLISKSIAIALFFTVFPLTAFGSRFLLLGIVQAWPRRAMLIFAFAAMGGAFWLLSLTSQAWVVVLVAFLFGLGSSMSYPMLNAWVSEKFTPAQLATPLAIFNAVFNFGLILTPFSAGYIISLSGYDSTLRILATGSFIIVATLLLGSTKPVSVMHK